MNPEDHDTSTGFPAADIEVHGDGSDLRVKHSYAVVTPDADKTDFMVTIRASSLRSWRSKLNQLAFSSFPWAEVLLALSSLGIGAILSAWVADIALSTDKGKFFFVLVPPVTTAMIVGYLFVRKIQGSTAGAVASTILDEMPVLSDIKEEEE